MRQETYYLAEHDFAGIADCGTDGIARYLRGLGAPVEFVRYVNREEFGFGAYRAIRCLVRYRPQFPEVS